jgi:hypothetical protein
VWKAISLTKEKKFGLPMHKQEEFIHIILFPAA